MQVWEILNTIQSETYLCRKYREGASKEIENVVVIVDLLPACGRCTMHESRDPVMINAFIFTLEKEAKRIHAKKQSITFIEAIK